MEQKMYSAVLRYRGQQMHTLPISEITYHELKLLVFVHGIDAFPTDQIKYVGKKVIEEVRFVDGRKQRIVISSEMDELKRLARKYDPLSDHTGVPRGRKYVEDCFKMRLDDFETAFEQVDPILVAEQAAIQAEMKAEAEAKAKAEVEAQKRSEMEKAVAGLPPASGFGIAGQFRASASEGIQP